MVLVTIHIWPEYQYNIENVVKYLCDIFSTNNYKMRTINRGVISITT